MGLRTADWGCGLREILFLVVLIAAVIAIETFLNFLVTNRVNLALFTVFVIVRVLFLAANARRGPAMPARSAMTPR